MWCWILIHSDAVIEMTLSRRSINADDVRKALHALFTQRAQMDLFSG